MYMCTYQPSSSEGCAVDLLKYVGAKSVNVPEEDYVSARGSPRGGPCRQVVLSAPSTLFSLLLLTLCLCLCGRASATLCAVCMLNGVTCARPLGSVVTCTRV